MIIWGVFGPVARPSGGQHSKTIFSVIFGQFAANEESTFLKIKKKFFLIHPTAVVLNAGPLNIFQFYILVAKVRGLIRC